MSGPSSGGIFISYRRQQTSDIVGRLYVRLAAHFGDDQVFMDVDTIVLGVDFAEVITQAISTCQVLLAVIGPEWLAATDADGHPRLDYPDDIVRMEIEAALERDIPVIPVIVAANGLRVMWPPRGELSGSLARLARRNALIVHKKDRFHSDVDRLVAVVANTLRGAERAATATPRHTAKRAKELEASYAWLDQPTTGQIRSDIRVSSTLRVFLCHASSDKRIVRFLYRKLQSEGIEPWLDEVDIVPGQDWDLEIRKAIRKCHVVLVCLSKASINKVGYIQKEIRHVLDVADEQLEDTIFLIPVRLEDCEVPLRLSRWQWVDLFEENGYGRLMLALTTKRKRLE